MRDEDGGPCGLSAPSGLGSEPGSATEAECARLLELDFLDTGSVQVESLALGLAALFPLGTKPARPGISTRSWGQEQAPVLAGSTARDIVTEIPCPITPVDRLLTTEGRCQGGSTSEVLKGFIATILERRWDLFQKDMFPSGGFGPSVSFQISCALTCPFPRVEAGRPASVLNCGWGCIVGLSGRRVF